MLTHDDVHEFAQISSVGVKIVALVVVATTTTACLTYIRERSSILNITVCQYSECICKLRSGTWVMVVKLELLWTKWRNQHPTVLLHFFFGFFHSPLSWLTWNA